MTRRAAAAAARASAQVEAQAPAEPTREQLQLAFRQLRRPSGWPASLDAALQHPVYGICLRAMARNLGRPAWLSQPVAPSLPRGFVPPTPTVPPLRQQPARPRTELGAWPARRGGHDCKKLCANDKD